MKRKNFLPIIIMSSIPIFFCVNTSAKETETLTLSEEPWIFSGNSIGVSIEKELKTNIKGDFYATYFFNSGQFPMCVTINDGVTHLKAYHSEDKQTMSFKGAFDISSAQNYSVKYHEADADEQDGAISFVQDIDINCDDGKIFYHISDGKENVVSGLSLVHNGQSRIENFIYNKNNIDPSELSAEVYGVLETGDFDTSVFSVVEQSHNVDKNTYKGTFAVKTPEACFGLLTIDVLDDDEVMGTSTLWLNDETEAIGNMSIYNVDSTNIDNYKYCVESFLPADYHISNGDIEYDGTYEYPRLSFEEIYDTISTGNIISDITILDNGTAMKIDTNSTDASTWDDDFEKDEKQMGYLKHVNGCLGLPEILYEKMKMTPSGSGMYEESYEDIKVTWTYTAGHGFEILYEKV